MPRAVRKVAPRAEQRAVRKVVQRGVQRVVQRDVQRDMRKAVRKDSNLRNVFSGFRQKEGRKRKLQESVECRRSR